MENTSWRKRVIQIISAASGLITILAFAGITSARDLTAQILPWLQGVDRSGLRNDALAQVSFLTPWTAALAAVGGGLLLIGLMDLIYWVTGESIDILFGGPYFHPSVLWVYPLLPAPLAGLWVWLYGPQAPLIGVIEFLLIYVVAMEVGGIAIWTILHWNKRLEQTYHRSYEESGQSSIEIGRHKPQDQTPPEARIAELEAKNAELEAKNAALQKQVERPAAHKQDLQT
jgi:hypothetical protein